LELTISHSGSNKDTRKNQAALKQQKFLSLLLCWFILAVTVPAKIGAAIPQQQNSQHNNYTKYNTPGREGTRYYGIF